MSTIGYKQNTVFVIIVCIRHGRYIDNLSATAIRPWQAVCINYHN